MPLAVSALGIHPHRRDRLASGRPGTESLRCTFALLLCAAMGCIAPFGVIRVNTKWCHWVKFFYTPPMTTHHTDEKKPALGGLAEDEFWAQMDGLAARARAGDALAALDLSSRVLRMAALCIQSPNNANGAFNHKFPRPGWLPCPHGGNGAFCHCEGMGGFNPEWFK